MPDIINNGTLQFTIKAEDKASNVIKGVKNELNNMKEAGKSSFSTTGTQAYNQQLKELNQTMSKVKYNTGGVRQAIKSLGDAFGKIFSTGHISQKFEEMTEDIVENISEINNSLRLSRLGKSFDGDKIDIFDEYNLKNGTRELKRTLSYLEQVRKKFKGIFDFTTEDNGDSTYIKVLTDINSFKDTINLRTESIKVSLKQAFGNIIDKVKEAKETISTLFKSISAGAKLAVSAIMVVVAAVTALVVAFKQALALSKEGEEIWQGASRVGMDTATYQTYSSLLKKGGMSDERIKDTSIQFIKNQDKLANYGINTSGKTTSEIYKETLLTMADITDTQERMNALSDVFGEQGVYMNSVLQQGKDNIEAMLKAQKGLGTEMSTETIENSHKLETSISALKEAWSGLKNAFSGLIPILNWVVEKLTVAISYFSALLSLIFGSLSKASNATESYSDNLSSANETIEEIKGNLSGFDELNNLTFNTSDNDDLTSIDTGDVDSISYMSETLTAALAKVDDFRTKMAEIQYIVGPVSSTLMVLLGIIIAIVGIFTGHFVLAGIGAAMAGIGVAGMISNISNGNFAELFDKIGEKVKNSKVGQWCSEKWEELKTGFGNFGDWCSEKWNNFKNGLSTFGDNVKTGWEDLKTSTGDCLEAFKDTIKDKLDKAKEKLDTWKQNLSDWGDKTKQKFDDIEDKVNGALSTALDNIKTTVSDKWNKVKLWWNEHIAPIFTSAYWQSKIKTFVNQIKYMINCIIVTVQNGINSIINKFNNSGLVTFFNEKLKLNMNLSPITIPQLQYMAKGGIVNSATPAIIGEAGAEAVIPLENNTQWMNKLATIIAAELGKQNSDIVMQIDGKTVAKSTVNEIQKMNKRNGYNILMA